MELDIQDYLSNLRSEYESLSLKQLKQIDWLDLPALEINEKNMRPSVWVEEFEQKTLLVVQLQQDLMLGWKRTDCIGSLIENNGAIKHVDQNWLMNEIGHP